MVKQNKYAEAFACANIALIKYWGKRNPKLNLPAVGSISLTLEALKTQTKVIFSPDLETDHLIINNADASNKQTARVRKYLDIIRNKAGIDYFAEITSSNNFPTGAGLASSASAFAALGVAASHAAGLILSKTQLSVLARQGSGSAARSIFGGFVEMKTGTDPNGNDDHAVQLAPEEYWDLGVLILITSIKEKSIGSTEAMNICANTSPYYKEWVSSSAADLLEMREAISRKDFEALGELSEYSAMKMHALTLSSKPAIIYWNRTTIELIHYIRKLRHNGLPVYFTIDAGPQVKVITLHSFLPTLRKELSTFPGVQRVMETSLGPDANLIGVGN